jgi:hypothetical protein
VGTTIHKNQIFILVIYIDPVLFVPAAYNGLHRGPPIHFASSLSLGVLLDALLALDFIGFERIFETGLSFIKAQIRTQSRGCLVCKLLIAIGIEPRPSRF